MRIYIYICINTYVQYSYVIVVILIVSMLYNIIIRQLDPEGIIKSGAKPSSRTGAAARSCCRPSGPGWRSARSCTTPGREARSIYIHPAAVRCDMVLHPSH